MPFCHARSALNGYYGCVRADRADHERTSPATGVWSCALLAALALTSSPTARAEDWPQFRGPNRDSIWHERGIMQIFPAGGLKIRWRAAIGAGHSSPVVAHGRVYVTDAEVEKPKAWERVHCFDEKTGKLRWMYRDPADNADAFDPKSPSGPCPTPAVESSRVFTLGATGHLLCLDARKGNVLWERILAQDYNLIESPNFTPCPLVEGGLLLIVVGGKPGACVVAFDKRSGREVWRALDDPPRAFSSPIVISAGGKRQLIVWTPKAVSSLNPATGQNPSGTTFGIGAGIWLVVSSLVSLFVAGYVAGRLGGTFNGWLHGLATWATVTTLTILLLTTAAGGLVGAASGLGAFAVSNSDKMSRTQLPPAVQQQLDQLSAQARQSADQAAAQAQQTTPEQKAARAREVGQRAAKGGAVGTAGAAVGLILGALAAAFGGRVGQRLLARQVEIEDERRAAAR